VMEAIITLADDVSAIPKYLEGQGAGGSGAYGVRSRYAHGQTRARSSRRLSGNIDRDIFTEALASLEELVLFDRYYRCFDRYGEVHRQGCPGRHPARKRSASDSSSFCSKRTIRPTSILWGSRAAARFCAVSAARLGLRASRSCRRIKCWKRCRCSRRSKGRTSTFADAVFSKASSRVFQAAVTRIVTEMESGVLAQKFMMPEGAPTHIGTPGQLPPPAPPGGPPGGAARCSRSERRSSASGRSRKSPMRLCRGTMLRRRRSPGAPRPRCQIR